MPLLLAHVSDPPTPSETDALRRLQFAFVQSRDKELRGARQSHRRDVLHDNPQALAAGGTWSAQGAEGHRGLCAGHAAGVARARHSICLRWADGEAPSKKWGLRASGPAAGPSLPRSSCSAHSNGWRPVRRQANQAITIVPPRDADYLKGFVWALGRVQIESLTWRVRSAISGNTASPRCEAPVPSRRASGMPASTRWRG